MFSVLNSSDIQNILSFPDINTEISKFLSSSDKTKYFSASLSNDVKSKILSIMGLNLFNVSKVPMRLIRGDVPSHKDNCQDVFQNTYLVYLTSSPGFFILDKQSYPIIAGNGFVFNEGLSHETKNTGNDIRVLIGPMSESGFSVGYYEAYFSNESDALTGNNPVYSLSSVYLAFNDPSLSSLTISGNPAYWIEAENSSNPGFIHYPGDAFGNQGVIVYPAGDTLCYGEDTEITCLVNGKEEQIPIKEMSSDHIVKIYTQKGDSYRKIDTIGTGFCSNGSEKWQDNMYVLTAYPNLTKPLTVTGGHSILVDTYSHSCICNNNRPVQIEGKFLLLAGLAPCFKKIEDREVYRYYHFCLESEDENIRHAVYANGILSETPSKAYFKKHPMKLYDWYNRYNYMII